MRLNRFFAVLVTMLVGVGSGYADPAKDSIRLDHLSHELLNVQTQLDSTQRVLDEIRVHQDYVIENYEIQNNTILAISTILGILLTLVIVYFGWRAQRVENEYERAQNDRDRIREQFDVFFKDLRIKKEEMDIALIHVKEVKTSVQNQRDSLTKLIEEFIVTYTKEYVESNKDALFGRSKNESQIVQNLASDQLVQIAEKIELLEKIHHETNPKLDYKKIDIYFNAQKYDKVIDLSYALIQNGNFDKSYYFNYAYSLAEIGEIDKAFHYYQEYVNFFPNSSAAHNNIGVILQKRNETRLAVSSYERALVTELKARYLVNLISCYEDQSQKLEILKKYFEQSRALEANSEERESIRGTFILFIEENLCFNELLELYQLEYKNEQNSTTYINLLEASVLVREESIFNLLVKQVDSIKLDAGHKFIFYFLVSLNKLVKNENCQEELNNIDILLEDKNSLDMRWRFNLVETVLVKLPPSPAKTALEKVILKYDQDLPEKKL